MLDPNVAPASDRVAPESESVQWRALFKQSFFFLSVQHGFRAALDSDTRRYMGGKFFSGYWNSVSSVHGWADGDPAFVNYVGHPIQGAIAGDIWIHNDPRFRDAEFGANRQYWASRLRAAAFAWAYSEQFEIGPFSEASIGHIQQHFPQQGMVDHVITPTMGMAWMIAEDAVDHYLVRRIEARTNRRWVRVLARGFLNPARSFANCMELELPWNRETRFIPSAAWHNALDVHSKKVRNTSETAVPPVEFAINFNGVSGSGNLSRMCTGGGGSATVNLNSVVGLEADVSGCKLLGLAGDKSGDLMTFVAGPRFSYRNSSHWTPWMHVLFGGEKVSEEVLNPDLKAALELNPPPGVTPHELHDRYTQSSEKVSLAMAVGGGVDWSVNRMFAVRVGNVDYVRTWMNEQPLRPPDFRLTTGVVFRLGD
jgi:hypothetical protein